MIGIWPMFDIPRVKNYPPSAAQCDVCGGHGCDICDGRGWLSADHPEARRCARQACGKPLRPNHLPVYCSIVCAVLDA